VLGTDLSRASCPSPPASWGALRCARVPTVDYVDDPLPPQSPVPISLSQQKGALQREKPGIWPGPTDQSSASVNVLRYAVSGNAGWIGWSGPAPAIRRMRPVAPGVGQPAPYRLAKLRLPDIERAGGEKEDAAIGGQRGGEASQLAVAAQRRRDILSRLGEGPADRRSRYRSARRRPPGGRLRQRPRRGEKLQVSPTPFSSAASAASLSAGSELSMPSTAPAPARAAWTAKPPVKQ